MFAYDFRLVNNDCTLGTVYLPDAAAAHLPVVIYCHGWGGDRTLSAPVSQICEHALASGLAFVAFDFFGCGETGGDYRRMTYRRWADNLADVLTWCAAQPFADAQQMGCYAFSSGSTAALRLAARDRRIAFIVSVGTCISAHIGMGGGGPGKILAEHGAALLAGETKPLFGVDFGADFYMDTVACAPIYTMENIVCPALFLQGSQDNPYRCADAQMAFRLMQRSGHPAALIEMEQGNHSLNNAADEAVQHVMDWLLPQLNTRKD